MGAISREEERSTDTGVLEHRCGRDAKSADTLAGGVEYRIGYRRIHTNLATNGKHRYAAASGSGLELDQDILTAAARQGRLLMPAAKTSTRDSVESRILV
jgi:hypothetical protein